MLQEKAGGPGPLPLAYLIGVSSRKFRVILYLAATVRVYFRKLWVYFRKLWVFCDKFNIFLVCKFTLLVMSPESNPWHRFYSLSFFLSNEMLVYIWPVTDMSAATLTIIFPEIMVCVVIWFWEQTLSNMFHNYFHVNLLVSYYYAMFS